MPFLPEALHRLLEELPAVGDGLARSERELLEAVSGGANGRHEAFGAFQRREERPFMGDTVFWQRVDGLVQRARAAARRERAARADAGR